MSRGLAIGIFVIVTGLVGAFAITFGLFANTPVLADDDDSAAKCEGLPSYSDLTSALKDVVDAGGNAGLANNMWATVVDRDGVVCAVTRSGDDPGDQWPGSRVISAQKANTANAFSLPTTTIGFVEPPF